MHPLNAKDKPADVKLVRIELASLSAICGVVLPAGQDHQPQVVTAAEMEVRSVSVVLEKVHHQEKPCESGSNQEAFFLLCDPDRLLREP